MGNKGGFSWRRLIGVSRVKSDISRSIGIPLTRSGRERKIGRALTAAFRSPVSGRYQRQLGQAGSGGSSSFLLAWLLPHLLTRFSAGLAG